jgi:hypothetical protein
VQNAKIVDTDFTGKPRYFATNEHGIFAAENAEPAE